jgi:hypothetical protein
MNERTALMLFFAGLVATTFLMVFILSSLGANSRQMAMATVLLICVAATAGARLVTRYHN